MINLVCLIIINLLTIFILSCGVSNSIVCSTLCMSCYIINYISTNGVHMEAVQ